MVYDMLLTRTPKREREREREEKMASSTENS